MKKLFHSIRILLARLVLPPTHGICDKTDDLRTWINQNYPGLYVAHKPGKRKRLIDVGVPGQRYSGDRTWVEEPGSTGVNQEEKESLRLPPLDDLAPTIPSVTYEKKPWPRSGRESTGVKP